MSGYERYTPQATEIMFRSSQEEAVKMKNNFVGSEHLLLGILSHKDNVAAKALTSLGVTYDAAKDNILQLVEEGEDENLETGKLPYSARIKSIAEYAVQEANFAHSKYIAPEHLLLGILRERDSVATVALRALGITIDYVRKMLISLLGKDNPQKPQMPPKGPAGMFGQMPPQGGPQQPQPQQGAGKGNLEKYGRDLTEMARKNELDPVIGRETEIQRVIQILSRRTKNNPCLIGEPGVGKTAIVEGLARKIVEGNVPETIKGKRVYSLDLSSMVAGAKYRGEFEERLKNTIDEIIQSKDIILFIDELHTIIGAGNAEGAMDAANILKPLLTRGELQAVGATTIDEYRKHIEKDAALERRFQPVTVEEPTVEDAIKILMGLRDRFEAHHKLKITDDGIIAAVELSDRYLTDRFLPDKAIDLMDEAASKVRISQLTPPDTLTELEKKLESLKNQKADLITNQRYEEAAKIRDEEKAVQAEYDELKESWNKTNIANNSSRVDAQEIAKILSDWTSIPVVKLTQDESERLLDLEKILHERVIGQDEAVTAVAKAVRRSRVGLKDPKKPIGSFIFLGPTGVGKTELSKALAEAVFGDEDNIIRFDMSEYMEKHTVSRLIGSPPGYVGYDEGGQLTEAVRRKPYSVVLFDEIEKAHPDIFNVLLQILDDGRITDGQGRTVDFKNTIIIMTSNVGASLIKHKTATLGFITADAEEEKRSEYEQMKETVLTQLRNSFRPEFLNRIDETLVFHALSNEDIDKITEVLLKQFAKRTEGINIKVTFTDNLKKLIASKGTNLEYGARPLKRTIQNLVEDAMSEEMLMGNIHDGDSVIIDADEDKAIFRVEKAQK